MPRKTRKLTVEGSTVVAVRLPHDLHEAALRAAGGSENMSEWLRNVVRVAAGRKLDKSAGFSEGWSAGWADANARLRAALNNALKDIGS
ncbi:MAG: hypothetical protein SFX73_22010 [Kofleriaceae bacterium]|nr:hypothetical protein [Kofleriaceae bacterium]